MPSLLERILNKFKREGPTGPGGETRSSGDAGVIEVEQESPRPAPGEVVGPPETPAEGGMSESRLDPRD